ncbi:MAG TPA: PQQ-dependent sugar dehydrogenase [Actinophytocola sp.]|uniref:PQQ-dependent sugar dehydrogenase n=1 Tax=Actinophytocola sp. TaxID=1872138 RepID=UPI002DBA4301|nr:PQQ-dependent sugar dehydrogenase [Actinophytocola sp.]HEU5469990.1 PQQ-dependent sugar dehydrogenase [Actinophytocola sp.]
MRFRPVLLLAILATVTSCSGDAGVGQIPAPTSGGEPSTPSSTAKTPTTPGFKIETVAGGLQHGWDIGFLPDGKVLISERPARLTLLSSAQPGATATRVQADLGDVLVRGEGGLMGMAIHPDFASSRQFTTCQTHKQGDRAVDIRLVTWRLSDDGASATKVRDLLTGLPVNPSGRHSGCRPTMAPDGFLLVGTGDTASDPRIPQNRNSLGAKVLRIDLTTGRPAPGNPFPDSPVLTFGHRNIQGVAVRPDSDQVFTAEHGPTKNDEVNLIKPGANYGWDPSRGGANRSGYDESVPMTDQQRFPDAVPAIWQSGETTEAICAATFLHGDQWGTYNGALVITALKGAKVLIMNLDQAGAVASVAIPPEFQDQFGRLRAARTAPDGTLYLTTTNGDDDKLLRVTPQ